MTYKPSGNAIWPDGMPEPDTMAKNDNPDGTAGGWRRLAIAILTEAVYDLKVKSNHRSVVHITSEKRQEAFEYLLSDEGYFLFSHALSDMNLSRKDYESAIIALAEARQDRFGKEYASRMIFGNKARLEIVSADEW